MRQFLRHISLTDLFPRKWVFDHLFIEQVPKKFLLSLLSSQSLARRERSVLLDAARRDSTRF